MQPGTVVKGEEEKMGRKEGIGGCDGGDERKKRKAEVEEDGAGSSPCRASVSCSVKWGEGAHPLQGVVRILQNYSVRVGAQPSYNHGPHSFLTCQPTPCLRGSSPRIPIFSLPIESTPSPCNLPSPDPGLMQCSLRLRTACWLLCPAHSLPSPTHHFQSLQYKIFCQIHLGFPGSLAGLLNANAWP